MKIRRWTAVIAVLLLLAALTGCGRAETVDSHTDDPAAISVPYTELDDGTFESGGVHYQYRLTLTGRMPNAASDTTFVYLSNIADISFERAWKAAGFSSSTDDYFKPEEAVLVEWHTP